MRSRMRLLRIFKQAVVRNGEASRESPLLGLTTVNFLKKYAGLPINPIGCYARNPKHPSLHLKRIGRFWSVRVGLHYRALAVEEQGTIVYFWVGPHAHYNRLIGSG